jgi:hypothetical protein
MVGSIGDGLMDLNKKFKSGTINMNEYYSGSIAGLKSLIAIYAK